MAGLTEAEAADITEAITASLRDYKHDPHGLAPDAVAAMVDIVREIIPMLPRYLEEGIVTYIRHEGHQDWIGWGVLWRYDVDTTPDEFRVSIPRHPTAAITFKIRNNIASPASWVKLRKGVAGSAGIHAEWWGPSSRETATVGAKERRFNK